MSVGWEIFDEADNLINSGNFLGALKLLEPHKKDHNQPSFYWILYKISLILNRLGRMSEFMNNSEKFCYSENTLHESYRIGKMHLLERRISFYIENEADYSQDFEFWKDLGPDGNQIAHMRSVGVSIDEEVPPLIPDKVIACQIGGELFRNEPIKITSAHHAITSDIDKHSPSPEIQIFQNAEYFSDGESFFIKKGDKYIGCVPVSRALLDKFSVFKSLFPGPRFMHGTALILSDNFTLNNYCHWTLDWVPRLLLMSEHYRNPDWVCTSTYTSHYHNQFFQSCDLVPPSGWLRDLGIQWLQFDEIVMVSNSSIGETHPCFRGNTEVMKLLNKVGDKFIERDGALLNEKAKRRIYISRSDASGRNIVNNNDFLDLLKEYDVETVTLTNVPLSEQIKIFRNSNLAIGVHGAGLTNIVFMNEGSSVIEIFNSQFGTNAYAIIAKQRKINYYYMSCPSIEGGALWEGGRPSEHKMLANSSTWIDIGALRQALENVLGNPLK